VAANIYIYCPADSAGLAREDLEEELEWRRVKVFGEDRRRTDRPSPPSHG
jgi:hypothetical protein